MRLKISGKFVLEHRYLLEQHLGRSLREDEYVHHKNGDRTDNRITNLQIMSNSEHSSKHAKKRAEHQHIILSCPVCKKKFTRRGSDYRWGIKIGQKKFYCSRKCQWEDLRKGRGKKSHGTLSAYFHCGPPRCTTCKKAMRDYARKRREAARSSSLVQETGLSRQ